MLGSLPISLFHTIAFSPADCVCSDISAHPFQANKQTVMASDSQFGFLKRHSETFPKESGRVPILYHMLLVRSECLPSAPLSLSSAWLFRSSNPLCGGPVQVEKESRDELVVSDALHEARPSGCTRVGCLGGAC